MYNQMFHFVLPCWRHNVSSNTAEHCQGEWLGILILNQIVAPRIRIESRNYHPQKNKNMHQCPDTFLPELIVFYLVINGRPFLLMMLSGNNKLGWGANRVMLCNHYKGSFITAEWIVVSIYTAVFHLELIVIYECFWVIVRRRSLYFRISFDWEQTETFNAYMCTFFFLQVTVNGSQNVMQDVFNSR